MTFEELGGAMTHATKSGTAHFAARRGRVLRLARELVGFLPLNNMDPPGAVPRSPARGAALLDLSDHPNQPYDIREVVARVVATASSWRFSRPMPSRW